MDTVLDNLQLDSPNIKHLKDYIISIGSSLLEIDDLSFLVNALETESANEICARFATIPDITTMFITSDLSNDGNDIAFNEV